MGQSHNVSGPDLSLQFAEFARVKYFPQRYCESLSSIQISVLVPIRPGNLPAASLTRQQTLKLSG